MAAQYVANIGRRIRERRDELHLSQEDVARELPGKVSGNQVSRWERGLHRPNDAALEALAKALEVEVAYFLSDGPLRVVAELNADGTELEVTQLDRIEEQLVAIAARLEAMDADALERDEETSDQLAALRAAVGALAAPARRRKAS